MYNTNDKTNLANVHEEYIREVEEKEEVFDDAAENTISEEELEHIQPDLKHKFPSPTMNSYLMTIHHNDSDKFIDYPEYFSQYCR